MADRDFNKSKLIDYWITGAEDDFETMMDMYAARKFNWSLFIGHLMIE